jgi:hypothetical protein
MNSFKYEVAGMEPLRVFVGHRGRTHRYPEVITPGLHRARNDASDEKNNSWVMKSRIAKNVLKQRFLEHENKPLTDMEALGVLQHHYIIGSTDLLDLTFDINVAKWFSLNVFADGKYQKKKFLETTDIHAAKRDASCVYSIAVRSIGEIELDDDAVESLTMSWAELVAWP